MHYLSSCSCNYDLFSHFQIGLVFFIFSSWISPFLCLFCLKKASYLKFAFINSEFLILVPEGKQIQLLLNVGGPDRVSRVKMAEAVAQFRGYDNSLIKSVSASVVRIVFHIMKLICDERDADRISHMYSIFVCIIYVYFWNY